MVEPTTPTRLLKVSASVARGLLWCLLAAWLVLIAGWGALHGWIVPRIGEFRPWIEREASTAIGVPVRIGAISARSEGLVPTIELRDVGLLDAQGRVALRLPRVVAALSPRTLWHRGFAQLYIEKPELDVRRAADGRITVAGLDLARGGGDDGRTADWVFGQAELVVRQGTLRWTDEQRGAPPLVLGDVDLVLRNGQWRHAMRLDATPPPEWGDRFTLMGQFREPLLSVHSGRWGDWSGQFYGHFARVDVSRLRRHADLDAVDVVQGRGALRFWADVEHGTIAGGVADVALADVDVTLARGLQPLALRSVEGRVGGRRLVGGVEFSTQGLQFETDGGVRWPGGNLFWRYAEPGGRMPAQGELRGDRLDMGALARIAESLPLDDKAHVLLRAFAPQGLVESVQATWQGPWSAPASYRVQGRIAGFAVAAQPADKPQEPGLPGVRGASVAFDMTQAGGRATLALADGALELPGVLEEPVLPLDHLSAEVNWTRKDAQWTVQVPALRFANADLRGEARIGWHTADPRRSPSRSIFPGVLDLEGSLAHADGARIYRYLPLGIDANTRHYVREAVRAGTFADARFRVKGDLYELPFARPHQNGEFHIAAAVRDATYAVVPPALQQAGDKPWPALTQLAGELVFDRASLRIVGASAQVEGHAGLRLVRADAQIPDLEHAEVALRGELHGPLQDALAYVNGSPVGGMTEGALAEATGSGMAGYRLQLALPIAHIAQSRVQGSVVFSGANELRIRPGTPPLTRLRGSIDFTETGFALNGVQARALGGDVRLEGGLRAPPGGGPATLALRAQGTATAEGLRQASELGLLARLAQRASGAAAYSASVGLRRGVPEVQVASSLQGLALALPEPFGKAAEAALPLRLDNTLLRESLAPGAPLRDQWQLELGRALNVQYQRALDGGGTPRVLRGSIGVGLGADESAPLPETGVVANVRLEHADIDEWNALLGAGGGAGADDPSAQGYLPTSLAVRAQTLVLGGRTLHGVVVGGSREGAVWRANLDARELDGYVEYRQGEGGAQAAAGRVYARLARLSVPQGATGEVESLLDEPSSVLPALDIVVNDFELGGRRLGRLEVDAVNRGGDANQREWRLTRLAMTTPEAQLAATGNWAFVGAQGAGPGAARRTALNFRLDIRDAGGLLKRLEMPDAVRQGRGHMEGQVAWLGSPLALDYPSLTGQININVEAGQFIKADPGLTKLLGVLSLQSLPRRLALDFRDLFSEGFAFDFVRGDARIDHGVASTNNLQMKGVNAAVLMEGSADIARETQDLHVVVVPEINAGTASLVAGVINPAIGLGTFLAQMFLRGPLMQATTQEFRVDGTWADPRVTKLTGASRTGAQGDAAPAAGTHSGEKP
ncbi:YhdP family protein [Ramlibacter sp. H39-3-26]|uniref:YhdP family protein n=1 Tax=Curvibacter soli TaxID=3031331 RepID=UPI0023DBF0DE|nr:YhdP family protein [Ramlibacter sp. H39-3-26]MDF1485174.1 YhdP family protein [Ramlibacter sp. H39-3-26]